MENYIALLLLIVPGFISLNVYENLNEEARRKDKFKITIYALIFSVFIIFINYIIILWFDIIQIKNLSDISNAFLSVNFIIIYIILTTLSSVYVGYLWNSLNPLYLSLINKSRENEKKTKLLGKFVLSSYIDDGNMHVVKLEKNGKNSEVGIIKRFNIDDESHLKEISLIMQKELSEVNLDLLQIKYVYYCENYKIIEYNVDNLLPELTKAKKGKIFGINIFNAIILIGIPILLFILRLFLHFFD